MGIQQILDTLGNEWEPTAPSRHSSQTVGFTRKRWLQSLSDVIARPVNNRVTATNGAGVNVNANGAVQSTGIGTGPIMPSKFGEHLVQARATFSVNAAGNVYLYVYRTTGAIPANGAAPNGGDVIVGGDSFAGGSQPANTNASGALSFFDMGLNSALTYRYYLAIKGPNTDVVTIGANSQVVASEF